MSRDAAAEREALSLWVLLGFYAGLLHRGRGRHVCEERRVAAVARSYAVGVIARTEALVVLSMSLMAIWPM